LASLQLRQTDSPSHAVFAGLGRLSAESFQYPEGMPVPWRPMAVVVTPEHVEALWGKKSLGSTPRDLFRRHANTIGFGKPDLARIRPEFGPGEGLGVYAFQGAMSFRRLEVEPLPVH
jgi:hypothetical protein